MKLTKSEKYKREKTYLWQIWDLTFNDEKFCFFADDEKDASKKFRGWVNYHSFDVRDFALKGVKKPRYNNNIHDEWVN